MKDYKNIEIKCHYESADDNLIQSFYIPALECAKYYDRIAGFFTSASLSIAAKGIAGLITNKGKMRLITSPNLTTEDIKIIKESSDNGIKFLSDHLLSNLKNVQDEFEKDHLMALGWMLAKGYLEIRLACPTDDQGIPINGSLFHQKVGILTDTNGNRISFSGSINETASAWLSNVEEFKVFKEWEPGEKQYLNTDHENFQKLWDGEKNKVKVVDIPQAVKEHLMKGIENFSIERISVEKYVNYQKQKEYEKSIEEKLSLFQHQKEALEKWKDSNYQMSFEMATGAGKTRTALACVHEAMRREDKLIVIISCPQSYLSKQWKKNEVDAAGLKFDACLIADGTSRNWKKDFEKIFLKISTELYKHIIVYTTHTTSSGKKFLELIEKNCKNVEYCFVGDEAHGLGASKYRKALFNGYKYRIGLSATLDRQFDEEGTKLLREYFGNVSFSFSRRDALINTNPLNSKHFLSYYNYFPILVSLSDDELSSYKEYTNRIIRMPNSEDDDAERRKEKLLFERANIVKNAVSKYQSLKELLSKDEIKPIEKTIIFVSPEQIERVCSILVSNGIIFSKFTQELDACPSKKYNGMSEREFVIKKFEEGSYKVLLAIKCLDEGIDIPGADTAILMANSTNSREYVQRLGRVIRQAENKNYAFIYDFVVHPDPERMDDIEKKIFENECDRAKQLADDASNRIDVIKKLYER